MRRIVTRILNRFEADGLVVLGRERIEVLDVRRLRAVASGHTDTSYDCFACATQGTDNPAATV